MPSNSSPRLAIIGSRSLHPCNTQPHAAALALVESFVAALPPDAVVVSGVAVGPDRWAERAARARGLAVLVFLPDWERHGKRAGFSRGTLDSVRRAERRGLPVRVERFG